MFDLKSKARDVIEHGYCVLESVYDDRECEQMRGIFKQLCADKNGFSSEQPTISFHPLLEWGPKMAPFFAKAVVVDAMAEVFQDDVRLAHSGAAVFNNALVGETLTNWHVHYAWEVPRQDFSGIIRSGCSAISMWMDPIPTLDLSSSFRVVSTIRSIQREMLERSGKDR